MRAHKPGRGRDSEGERERISSTEAALPVQSQTWGSNPQTVKPTNRGIMT